MKELVDDWQYKLTVITVCYNASSALEKTIKSIESQICKEFEYLIIDGGSKDETLSIIKKYEPLFGNRLKWISEPDKGIYDAMNKGISMANGKWTIYMNAGDVFYNERVIMDLLAIQYDRSIGIIYGDVDLDFGEAGIVRRSLHKFKQSEVATELCHQAVMTNTQILKEIKYDLSFKIMADLYSFKKIYEMGYALKYVPIVFAIYEVTAGVSATNPILSFKEQCRLYETSPFERVGFKLLIKALYKSLMLYILPPKIYNKLRYNKVLRNKKYQL